MIQGQLVHTCCMQVAGSYHVMELPLTVYKCRASLVKLLLSITFVLRAVLCAVRIKLQKEKNVSKSSALLYDQIISPTTISSSIEMPESGYNTCVLLSHSGICTALRNILTVVYKTFKCIASTTSSARSAAT